MLRIPTYVDFLNEAKQSKPAVIFISFECDGNEKEAKELIAEKCDPTFVEWSDLFLDNGEIFAKDRKLSSFKRIFVGPVHENDRISSCVYDLILTNGLKGIFYGSSPGTNNKLLQPVRMKKQKVEQVKTVIAEPGSITAKYLVEKLGLPVVSKIPNGSKGKGVLKHDTEEDLAEMLKKKSAQNKKTETTEHMIFQAFVPNDGDYRVCFVGDELVFAIKRKRVGKDFRNNISLGGTQEDVELSTEARALAIAANKAMEHQITDITGVDLIQDSKTGKWQVMEINSCPQFTGKTNEVLNAIFAHLL